MIGECRPFARRLAEGCFAAERRHAFSVKTPEMSALGQIPPSTYRRHPAAVGPFLPVDFGATLDLVLYAIRACED